MFLIFALAFIALVFTFVLAQWLLARDQGPADMRQIATYIREGAEGFLKTQYSTIARYAAMVAGLLFLLYLLRPNSGGATGVSSASMAVIIAGTFSTGAFMSGVAGYVGMWISVRANVRTAAAATRSYQEAIDVGLRGGAVCGLLVVGLCVLGLTTLFVLLRATFPDMPAHLMPNLLVGFGFGASLVALFAQLGGGIYTKAADVGADLVGKVEAGIPEDDPRNPAVIADLVGDNVGDCAGRGADLFESISAEIIGAMLLGGARAARPHAMLCYAMLCYAMLCYAMLCQCPTSRPPPSLRACAQRAAAALPLSPRRPPRRRARLAAASVGGRDDELHALPAAHPLARHDCLLGASSDEPSPHSRPASMLCCAMICYAMLCCAVRCYAMRARTRQLPAPRLLRRRLTPRADARRAWLQVGVMSVRVKAA